MRAIRARGGGEARGQFAATMLGAPRGGDEERAGVKFVVDAALRQRGQDRAGHVAGHLPGEAAEPGGIDAETEAAPEAGGVHGAPGVERVGDDEQEAKRIGGGAGLVQKRGEGRVIGGEQGGDLAGGPLVEGRMVEQFA